MAVAANVKTNLLLLSKRNESLKFSGGFNVRNIRLNTWTIGATSKINIVSSPIENGNRIVAVCSSEHNLKADMWDSHGPNVTVDRCSSSLTETEWEENSRDSSYKNVVVHSRCDCLCCEEIQLKRKAGDAVSIFFLFIGVLAMVEHIVEKGYAAVEDKVKKMVQWTEACLFKIKWFFHLLVMKLKQIYAAVLPIAETFKDTKIAAEQLVENKSMIELKEDSKISNERVCSDNLSDGQTVKSIESNPVTEIEKIVDMTLIQDLEDKIPPRDCSDWSGTTFESMEKKIFNPLENSNNGDNYREAVEHLIAIYKEQKILNDLLRRVCKLLVSKSKNS